MRIDPSPASIRRALGAANLANLALGAHRAGRLSKRAADAATFRAHVAARLSGCGVYWMRDCNWPARADLAVQVTPPRSVRI